MAFLLKNVAPWGRAIQSLPLTQSISIQGQRSKRELMKQKALLWNRQKIILTILCGPK